MSGSCHALKLDPGVREDSRKRLLSVKGHVEGVLRMLEDRAVTSVNGKRMAVEIDSVCVHGDNPGSVALARRLRSALEGAGVAVTARWNP